jgi:alpha-beta hydrolase superfamily lysophospholipase
MGIATAQGGLPVNQDTSVGYTLNFTGHNKIKLTADRYGDPTAPTVLFLHGGGQTRHAWAQTATRLAKQGYCAITLDARGHGDSEWSSDGDYSGQALSKDLLAVLSQLPAPPHYRWCIYGRPDIHGNHWREQLIPCTRSCPR